MPLGMHTYRYGYAHLRTRTLVHASTPWYEHIRHLFSHHTHSLVFSRTLYAGPSSATDAHPCSRTSPPAFPLLCLRRRRVSSSWPSGCGNCSKSLEIVQPRTTSSFQAYATYDLRREWVHQGQPVFSRLACASVIMREQKCAKDALKPPNMCSREALASPPLPPSLSRSKLISIAFGEFSSLHFT